CIGVTSMGSDAAPMTMSLPFGPRPSINSDIAFELGAVARITCAPPNFCNSSAAFVDLLSMYRLAPSLFASAAFSGIVSKPAQRFVGRLTLFQDVSQVLSHHKTT